MSLESSNLPQRPSEGLSIRARNSGLRNTYRLAMKELKEILRDRRTIITLVAMPLLIYPLVSILLQKFYLSSAGGDQKVIYKFVLEQEFRNENGELIEPGDSETRLDEKKLIELFTVQFINTGEAFVFPELEFPYANLVVPLDAESVDPQFVGPLELRYFEDNSIQVRSPEDATLEEMVLGGTAHVGLRLIRKPGRPPRLKIVQLNEGVSSEAASYVRKRMDVTNLIYSKMQIARATRQLLKPFYDTVSLKGQVVEKNISMSSLVPLILILMTVTGAVYPAIDLTAGERERGTLEALIAAPVPRFQVLFAKYVGVLTVAMLTAVVNMCGMFLTLGAFGLLPILFGPGTFSWLVIFQIFVLLLLFAGFFSAVLLAVTSFARSFKEAQAYIVPVTLLSITPGIISLIPWLKLSGVVTVIPLVNIVLLAREIMDGNATTLPAIVAITSTTLYGLAALSVAASIFGSDSILYGNQPSWRALARRPERLTDEVTGTRAFACLATLFPLSFMSLALVGRVPQWISERRAIPLEDVPYAFQLVPFVISTILVFVGIPSLFLWHGRIHMRKSLGFRLGSLWAYPAALLIGVSMWVLSGQLVESVNQLMSSFDGAATEPEWKARLLEKARQIVDQWRTVSPVIIVFCFSVIPAICEEFFFRGMLLKAIAMRNKSWVAILLSALVFGIFHTLSLTDLSSQKFLPSFLAGLVLAWLAMKSGSILPGILLHSLNNGILVSLAYFEDQLVAAEWIDASQSGFPAWSLWLAGSGLLAGCLLVIFLVKPKRAYSPETKAP